MMEYEIIGDNFLNDDIFDSEKYGDYDELILDISRRMKYGDDVIMGHHLKTNIDKGLLLSALNKIDLININSMNLLIHRDRKRDTLKLCVWIQRYINKIIEVSKYDNFMTNEILDYVVACVCLFEYLGIKINEYDISNIHDRLKMDNKEYGYLNRMYKNITTFKNIHISTKNMSKHTAKYNSLIKYIQNISDIYNKYVEYMVKYDKYDIVDIQQIGVSLVNTINLGIVLYYNKRTNTKI